MHFVFDIFGRYKPGAVAKIISQAFYRCFRLVKMAGCTPRPMKTKLNTRAFCHSILALGLGMQLASAQSTWTYDNNVNMGLPSGWYQKMNQN